MLPVIYSVAGRCLQLYRQEVAKSRCHSRLDSSSYFGRSQAILGAEGLLIRCLGYGHGTISMDRGPAKLDHEIPGYLESLQDL